MNGESAFQGQPAYVQKTSNKKRLVIIFIVVFLLIIAALGALYLLGSTSKHTPQPTNPVPSVTVSATPTPASPSAQLSPTPEALLSPTAKPTTLSVIVLNGSGTPGAAGGVASALKTAGYTDVTTGNAKAYTYTGVTIYAKNKADLQKVQQVVAAANTNAKVTASVDATIPTDIEVIVGK